MVVSMCYIYQCNVINSKSCNSITEHLVHVTYPEIILVVHRSDWPLDPLTYRLNPIRVRPRLYWSQN